MSTSYLVFDSDTDELADVISLTESEKENFEKNNPNSYLEENDDFEQIFEEEDDFYETLDDEDEW